MNEGDALSLSMIMVDQVHKLMVQMVTADLKDGDPCEATISLRRERKNGPWRAETKIVPKEK